MPFARLAVVMMIIVGAGELLTQAQNSGASSAVASRGAQFADLTPQPLTDRIDPLGGRHMTDASSPEGNAEPLAARVNRDSGELLCGRIRSYLVAPDRPHSDATHLVGYTTCVPASRDGLSWAVYHGH